MTDWTRRPAGDEHAPYYGTYVTKVPEGDLLAFLRRQLDAWEELLAGLPPGGEDHRYAPGKWTIKEVVGHVVDAERVFSDRALWFARGSREALPSMDQDDFMRDAGFDRRTLASVAGELRHLRLADLELFAGFDDAALDRRGTASGWEVSVRALVHVVAGHAEHHLGILRERYLPGLGR